MGTQSTWGLISRVSSRTYRELKWLHIKGSRSRRCWRKPASKTDLCHNGFGSRPTTKSGTTPKDDTGNEPSSDFKSEDIFSKICKLEEAVVQLFLSVVIFLNIIYKTH